MISFKLFKNNRVALLITFLSISSICKADQDSDVKKEILELLRTNPEITKLNLSNRGINILPDEIGLLINLVDLNLDNNNLETLPEIIGNLASLETLKVGGNLLKELPSTIGKLENLKIL